jgi:FeS assembly SUF system protein
MTDRIIPLADAPMPDMDATPDSPAKAESNDAAVFTPDPLNTLKFKAPIVDAISKVFDPEIPVNIYEMGLIYDLKVDAGGVAAIRMTLTSPHCPAVQSLPAEIEAKVRAVDGVTDVKIDLVWEPPWDMSKMSEAARLQLGMT